MTQPLFKSNFMQPVTFRDFSLLYFFIFKDEHKLCHVDSRWQGACTFATGKDVLYATRRQAYLGL